MTQDQIVILGILAATIIAFLWGRWRHDIVALGSLLACVLAGLVPSDTAFAGFGHPAVITVACVLVLSRSLQISGAVDMFTQKLLPQSGGTALTVAPLVCAAAVLSAFMNNVGALALLMPVAVQAAAKQNIPTGRLLMPLAFGSILGGMTTLIGTPSNLIVAGFSGRDGIKSFGMFDFTPVGLTVALAGILFVVLIGWRLVPVRKRTGVEDFETGTYLTEAKIVEKSKAVGMTLQEIEKSLGEADAQVVGLIRYETRIPAPNPRQLVRVGDILVIEAEPKSLTTALASLGLKLEEEVKAEKEKPDPEQEKQAPVKKNSALKSEDIALVEMTVLPGSFLAGQSASSINLRSRYGINLLAVSRQGYRSLTRLRTMGLRAGDVLLLQGMPDSLAEFSSAFSCVPLAARAFHIPNKNQAMLAITIMAMAVGGAALGLVPASVSFAAGLLACMVFRVIPLRDVYQTIDWPVIVLLAGLIPVAGAMETTGAAGLIAKFLLDELVQGHAVIALTIMLVLTMTLSDFMNNAATAAVMCPIAIGTAQQLGVSTSPFLMAVAIGASCAFLTPIGHQNNTLILGPGGFHFGDYWRMGLPLEILITVISIPMLMLVWPF